MDEIATVAYELALTRGEAPGDGAWVGHGLGLDLLEPPWLDLRDETPLAAGMLLTPEPSFPSDRATVTVEETVLVTKDGPEPLVPWGFESMRVVDA